MNLCAYRHRRLRARPPRMLLWWELLLRQLTLGQRIQASSLCAYLHSLWRARSPRVHMLRVKVLSLGTSGTHRSWPTCVCVCADSTFFEALMDELLSGIDGVVRD